MIPEKELGVPKHVLQEYLEALAEGLECDPVARDQRMLISYAELQYRIYGGSRCAVCNTNVRHVIPVYAQREDGSGIEYPCLCTRCLAAERAMSPYVVLKIGQAAIAYDTGGPNRVAPQARVFTHART